MIVSEFIAWLQTQDQGATVEVLVRHPSTGYDVDSFLKEDFDPRDHADYTDLRGNPNVPPGAPYENSRTLFLGGD